MALSHVETVLRIAVGAALGGVIGYERYHHGRPVGLRTHLLVAMAAATFTVVSSQLWFYQRYAPGDGVEIDASRIAASVVSGIGFLAGGAILRQGVTVQGLTTAAGLWLVTAIGMCAGGGLFVEAVSVTAMGMVALTIVRRFENKKDGATRCLLVVELGEGGADVPALHAALAGRGVGIARTDFERRFVGDAPGLTVTLAIELPARAEPWQLVAALEHLPAVRRVRLETS